MKRAVTLLSLILLAGCSARTPVSLLDDRLRQPDPSQLRIPARVILSGFGDQTGTAQEVLALYGVAEVVDKDTPYDLAIEGQTYFLNDKADDWVRPSELTFGMLPTWQPNSFVFAFRVTNPQGDKVLQYQPDQPPFTFKDQQRFSSAYFFSYVYIKNGVPFIPLISALREDRWYADFHYQALGLLLTDLQQNGHL